MFRAHATPAPPPSPEDGSTEAVHVTPLPEVPAAYVALWTAPLVLAWGQRLLPGRAVLVRTALEHSRVPVILVPVQRRSAG